MTRESPLSLAPTIAGPRQLRQTHQEKAIRASVRAHGVKVLVAKPDRLRTQPPPPLPLGTLEEPDDVKDKRGDKN